MKSILIVGIGGFFGSIIRYVIGLSFYNDKLANIPYKIILVNLIGCFLIGILANSLSQEKELSKLLLITGFLGGFTTFSSFGLEAVTLISNHNTIGALVYILMSVVGGLLAVLLGMVIIQVVQGRGF